MRGPENEIPNEGEHSEEENIDHLLNFPPLEMNETALVTTQPGIIDQPVAPPVPDEENEPLFPYLTPDVSLIILRLLSSTDLRHVSWVNRTGLWLSTIVRIERYRDILANSLLWRFLPLMAQDLPEAGGIQFIEYFERGANVRVPQNVRNQYQSLSSFWATLVAAQRHPHNWNGVEVNDWTQLQAMAQGIVRNLPSDLSKPPATLHQFMNLCSSGCSQSEELELYQRYHALESLMSTLFLFQSMASKRRYNREHPAQPLDIVAALIEPRRSRWLTGFGLIALDSYVPGIFEELVRDALRIFQLGDKNEAQQRRLAGIECLLGRLSEADLLTYINPEDSSAEQPIPDDPIDRQAYFNHRHADRKRRLFIDAIDANYEFLMGKLSEAVLFRIERSDCRHNSLEKFRIIPRILNSRFLLSQFSKKGLAKILCLVEMNEKNDVIDNHPVLHSFLTFDVLEAWLIEAKPCTFEYAKIILSQKKLLEKLNNAQIVSIAQYLGEQCFKDLLNISVFRERLDHDKSLNDHGTNNLLMHLAKDCRFFAAAIAENPYTASLLTHDEIITLFKKENSLAHVELVKHESVLSKLKSAELLELIDCDLNASFYIASHHLKIFADCDLLQFVRENLQHLDRRPKFKILLETLPPVLADRSESLTGLQWLEFGCIHPNLALIIPDKHMERFVDADLDRLTAAHSENSLVTQKISGVREERRKELARREAEAQKLAQERWQRERQQQLTSIVAKQPEQHSTEQLSRPVPSYTVPISKNRWRSKILQGLLIILGLIGIGLLILGIASGIGIPFAVTITSALFTFLPWSAALTSIVAGFLMHMVSGLFLAVVSKNTEEFPLPHKQTAGSTRGFFELLGVSPEARPSKSLTKESSLLDPVIAQPASSIGLRTTITFNPTSAPKPETSGSTCFNL